MIVIVLVFYNTLMSDPHLPETEAMSETMSYTALTRNFTAKVFPLLYDMQLHMAFKETSQGY